MSFTQAIIEVGGEALPCLWRGPEGGAPLLVLQPLFEEMNRTRRLLARVTARLAAHGVRSCLPDLPGTGDHGGAADWGHWRAAAAALGEALGRPHLLAVRGAMLLADAVAARSIYALAPVTEGDKPVRDLLRARLAADREAGLATTMGDLHATLAWGQPVEAAGHVLAPATVAALRGAKVPPTKAPLRTVMTATTAIDGEGVDAVIPGPLVWRQSDGADPAEVDAFAHAIADDIAAWLARCDQNG